MAPIPGDLLANHAMLALSIDTSDQNGDMWPWQADFAVRPGSRARATSRCAVLAGCVCAPCSRSENAGTTIVADPSNLHGTPEMPPLESALISRARLETSNLGVLGSYMTGMVPNAWCRTWGRFRGSRLARPGRRARSGFSRRPICATSPGPTRAMSEWCAPLFDHKPPATGLIRDQAALLDLPGTRSAVRALVGAGLIRPPHALVCGRADCSRVCPANVVTDTAHWLREKAGMTRDRTPNRNLRLHVVGGTLPASLATGTIAWGFVNLAGC